MSIIIPILTFIIGLLLGYWVCATFVRISLAKSNEANIHKLKDFGNHLDELEKIITNGG
jgi:hypothetical protein